MTPPSPSCSDEAFAPTRWTLILRSRGDTPEAKAALSDLCAAYYDPVTRFLQRDGRNADEARELAQAFFATILAGAGFHDANPARGRFRSYLLGALKHFLADQRKLARRQKRGSGLIPVSLDTTTADDESESRQFEDTSLLSPETAFDRSWAFAVMGRALMTVENDCAAEGKREQFEHLKAWLAGDTDHRAQATVAELLGTTEGAVKVMVHRLRKRFRAAVRSVIAQTLRDPSQVDEELRHLIDVLGPS